MCCVCSLICKILSLIVSLLFIVAVVLLILWGTGILFGKDEPASTEEATNKLQQLMYNNHPKLL
ncbi:hypothetical protein SFRURICE_001874 [Spodoptera frugiperda]|nr:hypothetical protein SFRURICE_001874 [Spodoptera frugiperda]